MRSFATMLDAGGATGAANANRILRVVGTCGGGMFYTPPIC